MTEVIIRDAKTNVDNGIYAKCRPCYCQNTDQEEGSWCNLGYETNSRWLKEDVLEEISSDCKLEEIVYKDEEGKVIKFRPSLIEIKEN